MLPLYNLSIRFYSLAIRAASLWNKKAAAWVQGRRTVFSDLPRNLPATGEVIWMHCSSAGEFEQGKPVIEALKREYPAYKILVSFFSPSGYGVARNYPFADAITYLPVDTKENASRFFRLIQPKLVIFVKYDFWFHHLSTVAFHHVPLLLVSAAFRKEQVFFKPHGAFFRRLLHLFRHIFVQDSSSLSLLQSIGIERASIGGDTRFDRVVKLTEDPADIPFISTFTAGKKVIVAGSTWPGDEEVLAAYMRQNPDVLLILAPHEVDEGHIKTIQAQFPGSVLYSSFVQSSAGMPDPSMLTLAQTLVIDSVGLLSRLYRYATITYVGGGFTKDGIHNILEAAVWAKPVLFGPNFKKYREGREMTAVGGAASFADAGGLKKIADDWLTNEGHLQKAGMKAKAYIEQNTGATEAVMRLIQEKRLLTK